MLDISKRENGLDLQILYWVLLSKDKDFALIFKLAYFGITENLGFAKLKKKPQILFLDMRVPLQETVSVLLHCSASFSLRTG